MPVIPTIEEAKLGDYKFMTYLGYPGKVRKTLSKTRRQNYKDYGYSSRVQLIPMGPWVEFPTVNIKNQKQDAGSCS